MSGKPFLTDKLDHLLEPLVLPHINGEEPTNECGEEEMGAGAERGARCWHTWLRILMEQSVLDLIESTAIIEVE